MAWRSLLIALTCAALFSGAAHAADVKTLKMPKGEEVWYVSDHTLPMIAMSASIPAGSAYDPQGKFGLAAFTASLLDEGAGNLNATAFQTALSNRAIRLTINPGRDYLTVSLVTLTDNAKDAFQLLGLALAHPRFDQEAVQRVRAQILSSLEQEDTDPPTVAAKGFYKAYFHDHPYGHSVNGDAASINAITQADIKAFAAEHWVKGDIKIAVSGDVDPATLTQLLNSAFGKLPAKSPRAAALARPCRPARCSGHSACPCRSRRSSSACRASCAATRISFRRSSPTTSSAAAASRRG